MIDDIQGQVYHKLEEVLINTIKTWGLNDRDSKTHAELILDFGHTGVHDLDYGSKRNFGERICLKLK